MSLRHWLARLGFSFLIIAFALFWRGQKQWQAGDHGVRPVLWMASAGACVALGIVGVRLRHGPPQDEP